MRSSSVVVPHPFAEDVPKMALAEWDHKVEALAANGSHQALAERVGLRSARPRLQDFDSKIPTAWSSSGENEPWRS